MDCLSSDKDLSSDEGLSCCSPIFSHGIPFGHNKEGMGGFSTKSQKNIRPLQKGGPEGGGFVS